MFYNDIIHYAKMLPGIVDLYGSIDSDECMHTCMFIMYAFQIC